jgi:hypothetical protein
LHTKRNTAYGLRLFSPLRFTLTLLQSGQIANRAHQVQASQRLNRRRDLRDHLRHVARHPGRARR